MKKNHKIFVGTFPLSSRFVDLYADSTTVDGCFAFKIEDEKASRLEVGIAGHWCKTVEVFLHEALEFSFTEQGLRCVPAPDYAEDNGSYSFHMNHTEFSEAVARVGEFVMHALPELSTVFKKNKRGK